MKTKKIKRLKLRQELGTRAMLTRIVLGSSVGISILLISSFLFTLYYVRSVAPAALEKRIGPEAYQKCATYRTISSVFMFVAMGNYIAYYWYPLPLPLPTTFPWSHSVSACCGWKPGPSGGGRWHP